MGLNRLLEPGHLLFDRLAFFPVRHHSPAAAFFANQYIRERKPVCVLIEGPSDYNENIADLCLDHELPIAIYSFCRARGKVSGVFYPFCEHSPEYVAVKTGIEIGARVEFIDLPYHLFAQSFTSAHPLDAAPAESQGDALSGVYERFSVNNFNSLWDKLIESDDTLDLEAYLSTAHGICLNIHQCLPVDVATKSREAFMAQRILSAMNQTKGLILVLTGGLHSGGLYELLAASSTKEIVTKQPTDTNQVDTEISVNAEISVPPETTVDAEISVAPETPVDAEISYGCTLTPYTDERLDSYRGYQAGLPSPGFYRQVYEDRFAGRLKETHLTLLAQAVGSLRKKKQLISTADVLVAEQMSCGLANLRGHSVVFREDLMDGIAASVIKDEFRFEESHPLVDALRLIFRGTMRGRLSSQVPLPPMTRSILALIDQYGLMPGELPRILTLDLEVELERKKSSVLHRLTVLGISGFSLTASTGFSGNESGRVQETWSIKQKDRFHADCVEAAAWGATIEEALGNKIKTRLALSKASAISVADALLETCLMALLDLSGTLIDQMHDAIASDSDFLSIARALGPLLDLYHYNHVLTVKPLDELGVLLLDCFQRALWLLEYQGAGASQDYVKGIAIVVEVFRMLGPKLGLDVAIVKDSFARARAQPECGALACGAISGGISKLCADGDPRIGDELLRFSLPETIGDFAVGLLTIAGDLVHSEKGLLLGIDSALRTFNDEQFLTTVPALRLAFSRYAPREKIMLLRNLLSSFSGDQPFTDPDLEFDAARATRVMALESRVMKIMEDYGLRRSGG